MLAPIDNKFVAYGGPNLDIDIEVRGVIAAIDPPEPDNKVFYLVPDLNYRHLLIDGNLRQPKRGWWPPLFGAEPGYDWYKENIADHGYEGQPILKLETYGVGQRPSSADPGGGIPQVLDVGVRRDLRVGDHVQVRGLYAIDYSHPMYYHLPTSSFVEYVGWYQVSYAHVEVHPYRYDAILLVSELNETEALKERHALGAPVYLGRYTTTWLANGHLKGQLADHLMRFSSLAEFTMSAPPPPAPDMLLRLKVEDETLQGRGTLAYRVTRQSGSRLTVNVRLDARTADPTDAAIHVADYSLEWVARPIGDRCGSVQNELVALREARAEKVVERESYGTSDLADRLARGRIAREIQDIDKKAARLWEEARELGCNIQV